MPEPTPEPTPETTTDFELLQQALKPLRETIRRLDDLVYLLLKDSPVHDLTGHHGQRRENIRTAEAMLEPVLEGLKDEVWQAMYLTPITLIPEAADFVDEQVCRVCGCTEDDACPAGCFWAQTDLCSACSELPCARPGEIPLETQIAAVMERIIARCCVFEETLGPEVKAAVREYQELVMEQSRVLGGVQ